jgi:mono/diheme cytochrome c family protein
VKKWLITVLLVIGPSLGMAVQRTWPDSAQENYTAYCARCHGEAGHGDGPSASTLKTSPQDLADCHLMSRVSDRTIFKAIKDGGPSVGLPDEMPQWSNDLTDDEIHDLVGYVRTFCRKN